MDIQQILKQENVHIIDVREPAELLQGKVDKAINMPLSNFQGFIDDIKKMEGPKVFYCRSGNRSGQAAQYCESIGIKDVYNGGSYVLMESFLVD